LKSNKIIYCNNYGYHKQLLQCTTLWWFKQSHWTDSVIRLHFPSAFNAFFSRNGSRNTAPYYSEYKLIWLLSRCVELKIFHIFFIFLLYFYVICTRSYESYLSIAIYHSIVWFTILSEYGSMAVKYFLF